MAQGQLVTYDESGRQYTNVNASTLRIYGEITVTGRTGDVTFTIPDHDTGEPVVFLKGNEKAYKRDSEGEFNVYICGFTFISNITRTGFHFERMWDYYKQSTVRWDKMPITFIYGCAK